MRANTLPSNRLSIPDPDMTNRLLTMPNALTVLRVALTPVFLALIFAEGRYGKILALLVFAVASLTDFYDGHIARRDGTVTSFGRFMDPLADKLLVSAALIAFVMLGMVEAWIVGALLLRDAVITALRMLSIHRGRHVVTSQMAKWKTMLQLVLIFGILVFINVRTTMAELPSAPLVLRDTLAYWVLNGLVGAVTVLALISGVRYLVENRKSF